MYMYIYMYMYSVQCAVYMYMYRVSVGECCDIGRLEALCMWKIYEITYEIGQYKGIKNSYHPGYYSSISETPVRDRHMSQKWLPLEAFVKTRQTDKCAIPGWRSHLNFIRIPRPGPPVQSDPRVWLHEGIPSNDVTTADR